MIGRVVQKTQIKTCISFDSRALSSTHLGSLAAAESQAEAPRVPAQNRGATLDCSPNILPNREQKQKSQKQHRANLDEALFDFSIQLTG